MADKSILFKDENATREKRIESLLFSEELSDCKFVVGLERKMITAHRFVLAVMSPVFYIMFYGDLPETGVIEITDVSLQGFTGMLQYIYTGRINFSSIQHAVDVLTTAKKYTLPLVEKKCLEYLKRNLTPINCIELLELATDLKCASLKKYFVEFLRANTTGVITSYTFLQARQSSVTTIVKQDELRIRSELELFKSIERWVIAECKRKGKALKDMVEAFSDITNNLRFLSMSTDEFASAPATSDLLSDRVKVAIYTWFSNKDSERLPSGLSRLSVPRGMDGKRGTFTAEFSIPSLFQMEDNECINSQQGCTVEEVYWKTGVYKCIDTYVFLICTEDENNTQEKPKKAQLRVLNGNGEEVEVYEWVNVTRGWIDFCDSYYPNGHLYLWMCLMTEEQLRALKDTIRVEVRIAA